MSGRSRKSKQSDIDKAESSASVSVKRTSLEKTHSSAIDPTGYLGDVSSSVHRRSSSPLNISRSDEKDELAHLNDRLATYIDYVRKLEKDKSILNRKLHRISEEKMTKHDEIRKAYEDEITSLRKLVDDLARQKAASDKDAIKHKEDAADAKSKLVKRDLDLRNLQRKIETLERDISNYKQDYDKYHILKPEHDTLERKFDSLRRNLEAETVLRIDLENKISGLREEIDFKSRLFDTERKELIERTVIVEEEVEDRKTCEFDSRLAEELQLIRNKTKEELQEYKSEMEYLFQTKLDELREAGTNANNEASQLKNELLLVRKRSDDLAHDYEKKTAEVDLLYRRIAELERLLSQERENYESQLEYHKQEVKRLQDELEIRFHEFSELMTTKIALDQEILMYRKMLEGEESRLNLQSSVHSSPFNIPTKRRRYDVDYDDEIYTPTPLSDISRTRYSFKVTTSSSGAIEFTNEQDGQCRWVKLINSSNEEFSLGNWMLKHQADGNECTFKFHRTLTLKPGVTCTVWSSDAEATHNPPTDIVMKNQSFISGANIIIRLMNTDGDEQASCFIVRERIRATIAPYGLVRPSVSGNPREERCSMM